MNFLACGLSTAIGFTLIGITVQYFGQLGFVVLLVLGIVSYTAYNKLPIDRWRWRYDRWRHR